MARGGRRVGRQGAAYGNRTDLQNGPRLPVQAPTGQGYGEAKQQRDAQRVVPLAPPPGPPRPLAAAPGAAAPASVPPPAPLDSPTTRPDEPLTAGSAYGPGPGPEALAIGRPQRLSELLSQLPATGDLADLQIFARQRGL